MCSASKSKWPIKLLNNGEKKGRHRSSPPQISAFKTALGKKQANKKAKPKSLHCSRSRKLISRPETPRQHIKKPQRHFETPSQIGSETSQFRARRHLLGEPARAPSRTTPLSAAPAAGTRNGAQHGGRRTKGLRSGRGAPRRRQARPCRMELAAPGARTRLPFPLPGAARFQAQAPPGARPALCSPPGSREGPASSPPAENGARPSRLPPRSARGEAAGSTASPAQPAPSLHSPS